MNYKMDELVPIVAKLSEGYTSKESTSISYETANQLMNAVIYCINEYEFHNDYSIIAAVNYSAQDAYESGFRLVKQKSKDALNIYNEIIPDFTDYGNDCLHDTIIKGMPEFFKWYNIIYNPQDTILTLDYPILYDLSKYSGVDRVYSYLSCIRIEQKFLKAFSYDYITGALYRYNKNYKFMIDNICEIVLTNVIAHILAGKNISDQVFGQSDYLHLQNLIQEEAPSNLSKRITDIIIKIIQDFYDNDQNILRYLCSCADNISFRLKNAADNCILQNLF